MTKRVKIAFATRVGDRVKLGDKPTKSIRIAFLAKASEVPHSRGQREEAKRG